MELTIKEYAKKYHLSIYQVVRKLQRGELEGYSKEIDGKRVQFVIDNSAEKRSITPKNSIKKPQSDSLKDEIALLREEIKSLKEEVKALRILIEG